MGFLSGGKFTPVIKSGDASNFILTLDGIGPFLQNFKSLEPLKIEKWNTFFLKKQKMVIRQRTIIFFC